MRSPAAVSAAVWLLALLGPGQCCPAEDDFTPCSSCFYKQTPPQGASAGLSLSPLCHRVPGGRAFASVSRQACDTAVYSAFHLSHGWMESEEEEEEEEEEPEIPEEQLSKSKVVIPALLRSRSSRAFSLLDLPLQNWDSAVTTLVQSSIYPHCNTLEGDLYVLTGVGSLGAVENAEEQCQTEPMWSAVCCSGPEGKGGFGVGIIQETGEGLRRVSIEELEEVLGGAELFFEGCGDADNDAFLAKIDFTNVEQPNYVKNTEADDTSDEGGSSVSQEKVIDPENDDGKDLTQEASSEESTSTISSDSKKIKSRGIGSDSGLSETENELESNSSSTIVYVLATTLYVFKTPLRPIFSRITEFPEQVAYVLQEDLGVLCALPGNTCSVFYLLISDIVSGIWSTVKSIFGIIYNCFYNVYYCTSSMLGALLNSCYTGVTGTCTLVGDALGIFGDGIGNAWWVTKRFGGGLCRQSGDYVGTVASEMGSQTLTMGGGVGRILWRCLNGLIKAFTLVVGFIIGLADLVFGGLGWFFGEGSE